MARPLMNLRMILVIFVATFTIFGFFIFRFYSTLESRTKVRMQGRDESCVNTDDVFLMLKHNDETIYFL